MQKKSIFLTNQLRKQKMGCTGPGPGPVPEKPGLKAKGKKRKNRDFYSVKSLEFPDQKPGIQVSCALKETTEQGGATLTGRNWN